MVGGGRWISSGSGYDGPLVGCGNWKTLVIGYGSLDGFYEVGLDRGASNRPSCPKDRVDNLWRMGFDTFGRQRFQRINVSHKSANFVRIRGRLPRPSQFPRNLFDRLKCKTVECRVTNVDFIPFNRATPLLISRPPSSALRVRFKGAPMSTVWLCLIVYA